MFVDVTVIVDGAVDETATIFDSALLDLFHNEVSEDAKAHGYHTEVYELWHDHPLFDDDGEAIDCECIQFETHHHPIKEYNA